MKELRSSRLRLRAFEPSDAVGYAELLAEPDSHPFLVEGGPVPAEDVPARIEAIRASSSSSYYALELAGEFVGYLALHGRDQPSHVLSYAVRRTWRRQGLALEALSAVCAAFPGVEFRARTHAENTASAALLTRAGFRDCGLVDTAQGPRREFRWEGT